MAEIESERISRAAGASWLPKKRESVSITIPPLGGKVRTGSEALP